MRGRMGGMSDQPQRSRRQILWARIGAVLLMLLAWALMGEGGFFMGIDRTFGVLLGVAAIICFLIAVRILWHFRRQPSGESDPPSAH